MLDKNILSQLSQLKADIHSSREFAEGVVASTSGRFGFVRLDDGRDAYLSPDKMQRVLPGDRIKVELLQNKQGKLEASLDKLIASELQRFVGSYRTKGNAHFVEPNEAHLNRWIFVAPKNRNAAKEDENVVAKIIQHPWKDGKAQAKVLDVIGKNDEPYYDFKFVCAKYALNLPTPSKVSSDIKKVIETFEKQDFGGRSDLRQLNFVTIDSASTRDMDDAVYIEKTANGYTLQVAIADPANFIQEKSALAQHAQRKAQTLYLNGGVLPMLAEELANEHFSLKQESDRPALVCTIELNDEGAVQRYQFSSALICSKHKLNYEDVSQWLSAPDEATTPLPSEEIALLLNTLHEFSKLRKAYRQENNLVNSDQMDYQFLLDENGKISEIVPRKKLCSHQLIEECMLLSNSCAGEYLAQHKCGIHTVHGGFRADRIGEARALLKEENISLDNIDELEGYCHLIRTLSRDDEQAKLIPPLKRMGENSHLDNKALPHMGIGVPHYATITSPIRRFADLYNHWKINALLQEKPPTTFSDESIEALNNALQAGRQADRELKQTLIVEYAQKRLGQKGPAIIRIVTPQGFGARFVENGIDGFVLFDKKVEKAFDAKRLTMKVGEEIYYVGRTVDVELKSCDTLKKRISLALI